MKKHRAAREQRHIPLKTQQKTCYKTQRASVVVQDCEQQKIIKKCKRRSGCDAGLYRRHQRRGSRGIVVGQVCVLRHGRPSLRRVVVEDGIDEAGHG
jgi:hypothetical protein